MGSLFKFYEAKRPRTYTSSWHHRWTCDMLERGMRERKNVILELPPRHGKSEIANVYRPAWWIDEGYIHNHSGVVCNSQALGDKFCQATRNLCTVPVSVDRNSEWKIAADESLDFTYKASGISGQITGWGFDDVAFDDLFKTGSEAKSETKRTTILDNVVSAAMNRLTPDGIVVAMQARLHPGDTIGWLLDTNMKFLRLHLPATNDDGQSAWFDDGYSGERLTFPAYEALWPTRYSREQLEAIFDRITSYYKLAQYQQIPSLGDLTYFDVTRMPRYDGIGEVYKSWIAVDAANTETKAGAFTAFVCLGFCLDGGHHLKVLGVHRGRWRPDRMKEELIGFYAAMGRLTGTYPEAVCIERAAGGYSLLELGGLPTIPIDARGSKKERAGAVCWLPNKGLVKLPVSAPWMGAFAEELENFPLTNYKDQTDAFVHALAWELRKNVDFRFDKLMYLPGPAAREMTDAEAVQYALKVSEGGF